MQIALWWPSSLEKNGMPNILQIESGRSSEGIHLRWLKLSAFHLALLVIQSLGASACWRSLPSFLWFHALMLVKHLCSHAPWPWIPFSRFVSHETRPTVVVNYRNHETNMIHGHDSQSLPCAAKKSQMRGPTYCSRMFCISSEKKHWKSDRVTKARE
jgi:hypothetical protein